MFKNILGKLGGHIRNNGEDKYADFGDYKVYDSEVANEVRNRLIERHGKGSKVNLQEVVSESLEAFAYLSAKKDPEHLNDKLHGK